MKGATYFLETFGCQMNILDSQLVAGQLHRRGMQPVDTYDQADLILFNTCSVRQHAEDKVHSRLGALRSFKNRRPQTIIGVIGCMAEREKQELFVRAPHVDLLCGPGELNALPALIDEVVARRRRVAALAGSRSRAADVLRRALEYDSLEALDLSRAPELGDERTLQSYVRVQRGCDKFCTYCVVPFTRGPERSRPPSHIVDEVKMLAERGCREVTLLGQTVNSYVHQEAGERVPFAKLLERVHAVEGIDRIRFVTSFPADWDEDIFRVMRDYPRIMPYLHIPAQSGSDRILRRMKRTYTVASYLELIDSARKHVPEIALAGDFIVGFCTETDEDFRQSIELALRIEYSTLFVFKYSPRPATKADRNWNDDVPDDVKRRRCRELLDVQREIGQRLRSRRIGHEVEVLVEGYSRAARKAQGETKGEIRTRQMSSPSFGPSGNNGARRALDIRHSAFDIQHSTFDIRHSAFDLPTQESEQDRGVEVLRRDVRADNETVETRSGGSGVAGTGRSAGNHPGRAQLVGRTPQDQIVAFDAPPPTIGSIVRVLIEDTAPTTMLGRVTKLISPPRATGGSAIKQHACGVALPVVGGAQGISQGRASGLK